MRIVLRIYIIQTEKVGSREIPHLCLQQGRVELL